MTNPLPASIVHRLANHLSVADQRAMRRLDPRFGELADTDWALPLLHRVSRLMEHLARNPAPRHWEDVISLRREDPVDGHRSKMVIRRRGDSRFRLLVNPYGFISTESRGSRDTILTALDQHLHQSPRGWKLNLEVADADGHTTVVSAYRPPHYRRQPRPHELALPPRRVRPRLE